MKEISIHTSTTKLAKKFILPIIALLGLYFLKVVPDEDIGVGSGGFFLSISIVIFGGITGMIIFYIYQVSIAKKRPVIRINKEGVVFPRHNVTFPFSTEYIYTTRSSDIDSPPNESVEGADLDVILDRKESYLYIWHNKKRVKEIHITWMNIDENLIAALCNDLGRTTPEKREALLEQFYRGITKISKKVSKRVFLNENARAVEDIKEYESVDVDLSKENKKWAIIAAIAALVSITGSYFIQESAYQISFSTLFLSSIIGIAVFSAFIALLVSWIPYKKLGFKRKYLRSYLLSMTGYSLISFIFSFFSFENKETLCHEALTLQKLKAKLVEDVATTDTNDPLFYEAPDSTVTANAIHDQLIFNHISYAGKVESKFERESYGIYDEKAEVCECKAKVSFKDNEMFLTRIRPRVREAERVNDANNNHYPVNEHLIDYHDYKSYTFSFVVASSENTINVAPVGYQIKELLRNYIEIE